MSTSDAQGAKKVIWAGYEVQSLPESSDEAVGVTGVNTKTGEKIAELFPSIPDIDSMHVGRSWSGSRLEDVCPCPQEACGLVRWDRAVPECDQHSMGSSQTMRQGHEEDKCPGVRGEH